MRKRIREQLRREQTARLREPLAKSYDHPKPSPIDASWAAGLFAGEGWCGVVRRKKDNGTGEYVWLTFAIQMLDEASIRRFADMFGLKTYRWRFPNDRSRWVFRATGTTRNAERVMAAVWPYLSTTAKGEQIEAAAREAGILEYVDGSASTPRSLRDGGNQWKGRKQSSEAKSKIGAAVRAAAERRRLLDE